MNVEKLNLICDHIMKISFSICGLVILVYMFWPTTDKDSLMKQCLNAQFSQQVAEVTRTFYRPDVDKDTIKYYYCRNEIEKKK